MSWKAAFEFRSVGGILKRKLDATGVLWGRNSWGKVPKIGLRRPDPFKNGDQRCSFSYLADTARNYVPKYHIICTNFLMANVYSQWVYTSLTIFMSKVSAAVQAQGSCASAQRKTHPAPFTLRAINRLFISFICVLPPEYYRDFQTCEWPYPNIKGHHQPVCTIDWRSDCLMGAFS